MLQEMSTKASNDVYSDCQDNTIIITAYPILALQK